jgi:HEAT repeat protein
MSTQLNKRAKLAAVVLLAVLLSNNMFAKNLLSCNFTDVKSEISERMIKNLEAGIASENLGLRRSCIYFAGLYEIEELVKPLINQLKKEKDANTKILIALALSKIGNEEGIKAVGKLAKNDMDPKVKRVGFALIDYYNSNSSDAANVNFTTK